MTVRELMDELAKLDPELDVLVWCWETDYGSPVANDAASVRVEKETRYTSDGQAEVQFVVIADR